MKCTVLIENNSDERLHGEWGLSIHAEYGGRRFLIDTGASDKYIENAKLLGINISAVDAAILSHAHYDHAGGIDAFFAENLKADLIMAEKAGENCYSDHGGVKKYIGIRPGILSEYADRIRFAASAYEVCKGVTVIPHKKPKQAEKGEVLRQFIRCGDEYLPDSFSHEQSIVFQTEKGLVIFSPCSHLGVRAIINEVQEEFPGKELFMFIGGMHLYLQKPEFIRKVARELKERGIRYIYTGHCTGDEAIKILREEIGESVKTLETGMVFNI